MDMGFRADRCLGYQQLTIDATTPQALTVPAGCVMARIIPTAQAARWRDDGGTVSATVGMPLAVGAELIYNAQGLTSLRFIGQVASTILNIAYYG